MPRRARENAPSGRTRRYRPDAIEFARRSRRSRANAALDIPRERTTWTESSASAIKIASHHPARSDADLAPATTKTRDATEKNAERCSDRKHPRDLGGKRRARDRARVVSTRTRPMLVRVGTGKSVKFFPRRAGNRAEGGGIRARKADSARTFDARARLKEVLREKGRRRVRGSCSRGG